MGRIVIAAVAIKLPSVSGEIGGTGRIEYFPGQELQFLQRKNRFAGPRAADDDQRKPRGQKLTLRVIETDSLVEPMKLRRSGIPVRQFREPVVGNLVDVAYRFDLPGIDHRAMQKSGLFIFMVINDFQQQDHFLSLMPGNGKQQPVTCGQFCPVIPGRRHFFDFRRNEIACFEKFDYPLELVLQLTRLQLIVT
ncbi:hypothetical protein [Victivallis vadensis]|uniref:hypothetical protein n=1 Tax=Victivallis vadensis TaxID=172901 RepID=UPI00307DC18B